MVVQFGQIIPHLKALGPLILIISVLDQQRVILSDIQQQIMTASVSSKHILK